MIPAKTHNVYDIYSIKEIVLLRKDRIIALLSEVGTTAISHAIFNNGSIDE